MPTDNPASPAEATSYATAKLSSAMGRRTFLATGLAGSAAPRSSRAAASATRFAVVDRAAEALVDRRQVPGVQVCVRVDGKDVFSRGYGHANLETGTPMSRSSVLRVGSMTKAFTAALIHKLAEAGKLGLSDPLARHVPDFPRAADMTLHQLLTHTSGLSTFPTPMMFPDPQAMQLAFARTRTPAEVVAVLAHQPAVRAFEPGQAFGYSNIGYILLAAIVEALEQRPYAVVLQDRLAAPLGLARTAVDDPGDVVPGRAAGYAVNAAAAPGYVNVSVDPRPLSGAGALRGTSSDLCRWLDAVVDGRALSPASTARLLEPARLASGELPKAPAFGPPFGGRDGLIRYGNGLVLPDPREPEPWIWHAGLIGGAVTFARRHARRRVSWAFIVNATPASVNAAPPTDDLMHALDRASLGL